MRGIIGYSGYVPWWRLEREAIGAAHGASAGKGTRAVASYDEDATSMGVEAARLALRPLGEEARDRIERLVFSTTAPAYLDKTNATAIHAALRLDRQASAFDAVGSVRSATGALLDALTIDGRTSLVVSADLRGGLPNSADEQEGGDGAAAFIIGNDELVGSPATRFAGAAAVGATEIGRGVGDNNSPGAAGTGGAFGPVIAEFLGSASTTEEFVDRWRLPGELRSRTWEERFGETRYVPLATEAWKLAIDAASLDPATVSWIAVAGPHGRACRQVAAKLHEWVGGGARSPGVDLNLTVGNTGAAQAGLSLAAVLDEAAPGEVIGLVSVADGADVIFFRATDAIVHWRPYRTVAQQIEAGRAGLPYLKFLAWKGMVTPQHPNRPEPARPSSSAAARNRDWKFGFVGSVDRSSGAVHLPPARVSFQGGAIDEMDPCPMAEVQGTIVTYTVDRLAYSPSPPIVFAVVDFDGGGRLPVELTDVDASEISIGDRVEMTFRRLFTADGIHNYFWKAKPVR
ncbi:MAG: OB-fold domain-containing protein [Acidimicrobiales bacterium]|nr:OB-fold domain-containing protein [Acidimicrobiales bacterium]